MALFVYSLFLHWFNHDIFAKNLVYLAIVAATTWLYYGEYQRLKNKRPVNIGYGVGISAGDSAAWMISVICVAGFLHLFSTFCIALWLLHASQLSASA
ncbi:hypothetical protein [Ideonella sp.]|uniref:hypothetical protein n=1 Tax=Ideonella sp. TaxID=1929293 RepID=UPI003BB64E69